MSEIYIAGVSMTHFGKHLERSLKNLTAEALVGVLNDAGCGADSIEAAFFNSACFFDDHFPLYMTALRVGFKRGRDSAKRVGYL